MSAQPKLEPTEEQQAAQLSARTSTQSLMISAYAGCAKTTTLELVSKEIRVPGLALAFNVSIKKELAKRFPGNFSVQTMNGLGFASLMRALPLVKFDEPDGRKLGKLVSQVSKEWKIDLSSDQWDSCRALVNQAMLWGLVPEGAGPPGLVEDTPEMWQECAIELLLKDDDFKLLYEPAREVLRRSILLTQQGKISFDDQVYYPTVIAGRWPQFPVLLVDEAQDLSPLNHAMLRKAMRPDGRLIACGDSRQAIYAFRGADSDSMGKIEGLRRDWQRLPLTLTFRCPKLVVERQQNHAPGFRAAEINLPGQFIKLGYQGASPVEKEEFEAAAWTAKDLFDLAGERSLAVLCRNNGPLLGLAFQLIRQRIAPVMLGRDIGKGLAVLARKLFPTGHETPTEMLAALAAWQESETSALQANGHDEKIDGVSDRAECLRAVIGFAEVRDANALREALASLFSRESGQITLASIHRSKGLEWDAVLHLDPWRIPSKWAREAARRGDARALQQEMNLKYVCETRTRDLLIEANAKEFL